MNELNLATDDDRAYRQETNAHSLKTATAYVEPSLVNVPAGEGFLFERHRYFASDCVDHAQGQPVQNLAATMMHVLEK